MHSPPIQTKDPVRIAAVATAVPDCVVPQPLAHRLLLEHYRVALTPRSLEVLGKLLGHPSIRQRYVAVDSPRELVSLKHEDPDKRIERFTTWALRLGEKAIARALGAVGLGKEEVGGLVVNTCTGYLCPGISTYLIERLGLDPATKAYDLVGSGCGGAIPNLQLGENLLRSMPGRVVLCVSIEICSATFQMGNDISLILSNAIFGDGAAAAVLWDRPSGPVLRKSASRIVPQFREDVRYVYRGGQLHNRLTPRLPKIIGEVVPPFILDLLSGAGLSIEDIAHWAIHPGGEKMIDTLQEALGLTDSHLAVSRRILADYGNMSSPTVLFELEQVIAHGIHPGEWCCIVAFGAGLSAYGYLLQG